MNLGLICQIVDDLDVERGPRQRNRSSFTRTTIFDSDSTALACQIMKSQIWTWLNSMHHVLCDAEYCIIFALHCNSPSTLQRHSYCETNSVLFPSLYMHSLGRCLTNHRQPPSMLETLKLEPLAHGRATSSACWRSLHHLNVCGCWVLGLTSIRHVGNPALNI